MPKLMEHCCSKQLTLAQSYRGALDGSMQVKCDSLDGRHFVTTVKVSGLTFHEQKPFEINEQGGWLAEPTIPSVD